MQGPPCESLLDYKTAKFSLTRNRRVGLLHRLLQLSALGYLLGWVLLLRKGYQERDAAPRVAVVTKVKGAAPAGAAGRRLWDAADLTWPPQGENVLFLVTNFIATAQQAQGTCPESPSVLDATCTEDADCPVGNPVVRGNGIKTGKCVMFNATHSTCEIYGWCPVENSTLPRKPLLAEAENFTLFIKNTVHFTKFNFSKCNTLQTSDPSYFKSCTYDPVFNPSCPVFRVCNMVEAAGENFRDLALLGGSIGVLIKWDCDLDHPAAQCQPQYFFSLQDTRYNFRTASYYWDSQRQLYRNLLKLYGLRFDISVHGQAGKFSIIPTAVSFGTSIAFFGAVSTPDTLFPFNPWLGICRSWVVSLPAWAQGFLGASQHEWEMIWQAVNSCFPVTISSNGSTGILSTVRVMSHGGQVFVWALGRGIAGVLLAGESSSTLLLP
ncbi:P2X purinoceptor 6-like isoform X1 [Myiozetetes cayanensis]|uniref:P2X purinoceptor 6-like isoform X1 n=1 Tax=Myiozetetes cayanensis TaxID=478635 RepID=UPI00215E50FE|nr:P2X purinoceptor 6-like isoform X1 [Myiozetetes cayanensis]